MKTVTPYCFAQARNFLFCYMLTTIYCWTTLAMAQIKKPDPKTPPPPSMSHEVFRAMAQFYKYDKNLPFDVSIVGKFETPEGIREKIVFTGTHHIRVPSYLFIPKSGTAPYPTILVVDGIFGSKERWIDDESWPLGGQVTKSFLNAGFAIMVLDMPMHGERSFENDFAPPSFKFPNTLLEMMTQILKEHLRALDYLSTRIEIDTVRMGMLGLSLGAVTTMQLSSLDSRIKTCIIGVPPVKGNLENLMPFASRIQSKSCLLFIGKKDTHYEESKKIYPFFPIQQKELIEYESGHRPPVEYIKQTTDWFTKNLKP